MFIDAKNRDEWLSIRKNGVGGSDAGAAVGLNKYKTNVDLWREKTREAIPEDISGNPAIVYGKEAEKHLRALFALDYPEYKIDYHEYGMYFSDSLPFMYATLDGEITTLTGKRGILEIKTTTIRNQAQWTDWDGCIPDSYYTQILHQLACTGFDFAILFAYIRYYKEGELCSTVKRYTIKRGDVADDIEWLETKETEFWESVKAKKCPPLILPKI